MWTTELKGRAIVSMQNARKVGTLADVVFRPESGDIAGFAVTVGGLLPGVFGEKRFIPIEVVRAIGPDAVTIPDESVLTGWDHSEAAKALPSVDRVIGLQVVSEGGMLIGKVVDVFLDPETKRVVNLRVSSTAGGTFQGFARGAPQDVVVPLSRDVHFGRDLIVVPDSAVSHTRETTGEDPWKKSA